MKKLLITAGAVGAAIAGLLLYTGWRKNSPSARQLKDVVSGSEGFKSNGIGSGERNPIHSMG
jgi:hypothetical protein